MTLAESPGREADSPTTASGGVSLHERSPRWQWVDVALLLAVLVIAACIRFAATDRPLNYDELWHMGSSTGRGSPIGQIEFDRVYTDPPRQVSLDGAPPFYKVWTGMDGVLHPPLFVLSLRIWRDVFGASDLAAQSFSIAWSMVALSVCFATTRLITDRWTATLVALAMAVSSTQIYFSLAVRGYEMLIALGSIAVWLMVRVELFGTTRRRAIALAAMTLPLLLTHYFAAGAAVAIGIYGLIRMAGRRVAFVATILICAAIYAVIWVPFALRQVRDIHTGDAFLKVAGIRWADEGLWLLAAPGRLVVESFATMYITLALSLIVAAAAIVALRRGKPRAVVPLAIWIVCCVGIIGCLDVVRVTRHALFIRYLAATSPAVFPIVVAVGAALGHRLDRIGAIALLFVALVIRAPARAAVIADSPGYVALASWLAKNASPGDALLFFHGGGPRDYGDNVYLHCSHEPGLFPRPVVKVDAPLSPALIAQLPRRAWLVVPNFDLPLMGKTFPGVKVLGEPHEISGEGAIFLLDLKPAETTP